MNLDAVQARQGIQAANWAWGRARVALDRPAFERMLAPDFHVVLRGQRLSRLEFIERISHPPGGATLLRFEARVLTVRPDDEAWVALIHEKLEYRRPAAAGFETEYVLAVTRDRWMPARDGWVARYSELLAEERWNGGRRPPFADW